MPWLRAGAGGRRGGGAAGGVATPATSLGLATHKGAITPGYDADLVVFDPDREMTVDASRLYHRHAATPYDGARLRGVVMATMLRGELVFEHGDCVGGPTGQLLIPDGPMP